LATEVTDNVATSVESRLGTAAVRQRIGVPLGAFRLVERLGSGAIASVYRARHEALQGYVAVKVLNEYFAADPTCGQRFQQAARTGALMNHPNVANVFDFGQEEGFTYLAMELTDGRTLADRLSGPMEVGEVVQVLAPIARALDHAHARGVLHLNIKPSNILFRGDGTPALADFGFATVAGTVPEASAPRTFVGSPEYRSPEQATGGFVGATSDVYSLAVVCRQMLTGLVPFRAGGLGEGLVAVNNPLHVAFDSAAKLPESVNACLAQGLAEDPDQRQPSATKFVAALQPASSAPPSWMASC
jgi:serine/threonine-protein kinase